jgi:hypothetical protein
MITEYLKLGWKLCPIPIGQKGPQGNAWNKVENALTEVPATAGNIGLMHGLSNTCAIDLDRVDMAHAWFAERGVDLSALIKAPTTVAILSGKPNSGKLIYTLPFPLPSKRITSVVDGQTICILEFRSVSTNGSSVQDVLPPSVHPSGTTYQWVGSGSFNELQVIPNELLSIWMDLIEADNHRSIPIHSSTPASMSEVRDATFSIDPDCDYRTWYEVGMGLATMEQSADAFSIWNDWSSGSEKYPTQAEMVKKWASFKPDGKITIGTVFHHAYSAGWKRPTPDITKLFAPIPVQQAKEEVIKEITLVNDIPPNDLSLWPDILVRRATELSKEVGCDPIVALLAGLSAVSGAVDKRTTLQLNSSWKVPPTWWCITIGDPSDKKTPGSKPMFAPLRKLELEDRDRYNTEMLIWSGKEARYAAEMKMYRDWAASPESELPNAVPPCIPTLEAPPEPLRLIITDATTQKVVAMSEHRPRGFLMYLDELNKWLSKLSDARNTDDRGCWIQGYETGPYSMDRMGTGTTLVDNMALSIYGNCQPTVFRDNVKATSSDGILQRFLPVVLNPDHNAMWQDALPSFMSSEAEYEQMIRRSYALQQSNYVLSDSAMLLFKSFCQNMLDFRAGEKVLGSSDVYRTALGKSEGNCARLILLFHVINDPYSNVVSIETVRMATELFSTFFIPSLRYVYLEIGQQQDPMGKIILNTIIQWSSSKPTITLADLRKATHSSAEWQVDSKIRVIMDDLVNRGYVSMFQDHPRFPVWAINPTLAAMFERERQAIIAAKQLIRENITMTIKERTGKDVVLPPTIGS